MGDVVADPSGSWTPSTAQQYIDSQIAGVNTNLASETIARQTGDNNLSTQLTSEMNTRASQDANLNALINAGIREGGGVQFDIVPTQNSANGITSGGMYSTLKDSNVGFVDEIPTSGSNNLVKSGGVFDAVFNGEERGLYKLNEYANAALYNCIKYIAIRPLSSSNKDKIFRIYAFMGDAVESKIYVWVRASDGSNNVNLTIDVSGEVLNGNNVKEYEYEDNSCILYLKIDIVEALNIGTVTWGGNTVEIAKLTDVPLVDKALTAADILETNAKNVTNKTISQGFYTSDKLREKGVDFYSQNAGVAEREPAGIDGIIECRLAYKNPSIFNDAIHIAALGLNGPLGIGNSMGFAVCNVASGQMQFWLALMSLAETPDGIATYYAENDKVKVAMKVDLTYLKATYVVFNFSNPAYTITGILDKNDAYWNQFNGTNEINIACIGDSLTEQNNWPTYAVPELMAKTLNNCAHGGGHFEDLITSYEGVTYYPQDYSDPNFAGYKSWGTIASAKDAQKMANDCSRTMVTELIAKVSNGDYPIPDVVVFAMGTNDTTPGNITDIFTESDYKNMSDAIRRTCGGAARWAIQKVKETYPNCKVFVCLPVQSTIVSINEKNLNINSILKEVCKKLSVPVIDCYNELGISYYDEILYTNGHYLSDGIHTNNAGKLLQGKFIAAKIYDYLIKWV